tara:strand:- start:24991 stop:28095 length:3105 start_codon:yes stop_codon:yes gene_type:complete
MIQAQIFVDTGKRIKSEYAISTIELLTANDNGFDATVALYLNGVQHIIPLYSVAINVNALEISTYINTTGTHRASWIEGTAFVEIEAYVSGPQSPTGLDSSGTSVTSIVTNSVGVVNTSGENWMSTDMDAGIQITIKDTIKKAKDIGKVFTSYTLPFVLPASKNNNIIFKRFSSNKIYDGFDPRRKYKARIKLNGVDFKAGYIKLNKVNMIDNLPFSYSCQFFGELASLKDTVSNNKLKDLTGLSKYTFPYTDANVQLGFEEGFDVVVNSPLGERETTVLQVIDAPTSNGDVTLALNLVPYTISLIGTGGVTPASTAEAIMNNVNLIDGYAAAIVNERFVYILADQVGAQTDATLGGASAIGMTYTIVTPVQGSTVPQPDTNVTIMPNSQGMFKFPLISHTRGFEYTKTPDGLEPSNHEGFHRLLTNDENNNYYKNPTHPFTIGLQTDSYPTTSADRLSRFDLKPAIKLPYIFDAIMETFPSIVFDTEWMFGSPTTNKSPMKDMYLWLHNRKGNIGYLNEDGEISDFKWERALRYDGNGTLEGEWEQSFTDGTYDFRPYEYRMNNNWLFSVHITEMIGDGDVTVKLFVHDEDTNDLLDHREATGSVSGGDFSLYLNYPFEDFDTSVGNDEFEQKFYIRTEVTCDTSVSQFRPHLEVDNTFATFQNGEQHRFNNYFNVPSATPTNGQGLVYPIANIDPSGLMPDYKIIDFLSDLFKMYNLVAYEVPQQDGTYKIKITSYDYFINNGYKYDITKYIDISKGSVERISPYAIIKYDYAKPSTFLAINQKSLIGDNFGNADFNVSQFNEGQTGTNSFLFDGGEYKVKVGLEKVMYERINDKPIGNLTPIQWGWFVNDNEENLPEPELGKPLLMFCPNKLIGPPLTDAYPIEWSDGHQSDRMTIPSNVSADDNQTLHFNSEYDEYNRNINRKSLFMNYHSNMIEGLYSPFAKRIGLSAFLPPLIFNKLRLSDTIIVDNISYFIDEMDINITTGKTKFSLLRVTDIKTRLEGRTEDEEVWQDTDVVWDDEVRTWEVKRNL